MPTDWQNRLENASTFQSKNPTIQRLIIDALIILEAFGLPMDQTPRRLERMAMAFLAVSNIKQNSDWSFAAQNAGQHYLTTRQLIEYVNRHFEENISSGSYDDVRRRDLKFLWLSENRCI